MIIINNTIKMVNIKTYITNNIEYIVFFVLIIILIVLVSKRTFDNFFTEQHGINRLDAIIYINLENRTDRKDLLLKELEALNTNMEKVHKVSGVFIPKNGHKGCIQSHILALNMIKLNKWQRVLILEDDATLTVSPESANNIINKTLDYLDSNDNINWNVVMLATAYKVLNNTSTNYNTTLQIDKPETPDTPTIPQTTGNTDLNPSTIKLEKILSATTSSAYIVKGSYVNTILNLFKKSNYNMDHTKLSGNNFEPYALDQQWVSLQKSDNWYALSPDIITQREIWSSIMSESHT